MVPHDPWSSVHAGRSLLGTLTICLLTLSANAQNGAAFIKRSIPAVRFKTPPTIDGDLSDPCWQEAAKADNFVDWVNGNTTIDQTIVYLGYDDQNFYLGWYCKDSQPKGIVARQTKRGAFPQGDDWVDLNLDPFHTHKWSDVSFFWVNPRGAQFARLGGGRATKLEWEGAWKAGARIVSDGWTAEMAIPWAILNYPAIKGPAVCGINFLRFQKRTNILSNWSNIGPNDQHPEFAGHWEGVEFPPFRPQLSLLPYAIPGWGQRDNFSRRSGLDLRYTLTPGLTAVGTVNPDFSTVEEAVEGIDFSYGERFVPDRRPFFQEGSSIYNSGASFGRYFYSQRIPAFDVGTNLYGKLNERDTLGVLAALDMGNQADWILRGRHEFGPLSSVDTAFINRDGRSGSNRVLVLGENYRKGLWSADASGAVSWVGVHPKGSAANLFLGFQDPHWSVQIIPHFVSPDFQDELGFIPFTGFKGVDTDINYFREWRKGPVRSLFAEADANNSDHYDGRLFRRQQRVSVGIETRNDYFLRLGWDGGRFEGFHDSVFNINLQARTSDPFHTFGVGYSWGRQAGAPITFITPFATWRFGERLTLGVASSLLYHQDDPPFQHILTFNYDFSPRRGLVGRMVVQEGSTNGYLALRQSGYGGVETFLILGDPNARTFQQRVQFKVVWPF